MLTRKIDSKKMLVIDFSCAFLGALFYISFQNLLVEKLLFPLNLLQAQLMANLIYGIFGLTIYIMKKNTTENLRFLMKMNALYAAVCLAAAVFYGFTGFMAVGFLLLIEAVLILFLVSLERKLWV